MPIQNVATGAQRTVAFAECRNGDLLAKEFLETLDEGDLRKVRALFKRMADMGAIPNREKFRQEEGEIFAFKCHQIRIGCFRAKNWWFLTHGFKKKSDNWPEAEIERAKRIRSEHLEIYGDEL